MTDFQGSATRQGLRYERFVRRFLESEGWQIRSGFIEPYTLIQVDLAGTDPDGIHWWIECKGSWLSPKRNGMRRTDTTKKLIANAALLALLPDREAFLVVTSHLPVSGSVGDRWLTMARDATWITDVLYLPWPAVIPES